MTPDSSRACSDANEATADVAFRLNELCALYPITPSSPMGELCDEWGQAGLKNIWGNTPQVVEMQSEAGAAGTMHGALQTGTLATTFTSSQGLLLMLPSMFKIAGELCPCVIHVAARAVATHALSIFGDHSDVMAVRSAGFAMLASASAQEAHDFALISHAVSLKTRIPFLHFFDGFRSSHELSDYERLPDEVLTQLVDTQDVLAHRERGLNPNAPVIRGTSQNPDVFFQGRESANGRYQSIPDILQQAFDKLTTLTGRSYNLVNYHGAADAERVIVIMASASETVIETVEALSTTDEKIGVMQIRLYRPWPAEAFLAALPPSVTSIAVLDRSKESGSFGEPLFLDVAATLQQSNRNLTLIGGRYGLGSKEFTPAMVKTVFDELKSENPKARFTVGIDDDVSHTSLSVDPHFHLEDPDCTRAVFYGLGADGTVGANKNSIKILSKLPGMHVQGYFEYDSNKSGSRTVSHLRFGPKPIAAHYLIESANFVACHSFGFTKQIDVLAKAAPGATFLLNTPHAADQILAHLPRGMQEKIQRLQLKMYVIDATRVARECGLGGRINTIMQSCFFKLNGVLPEAEALKAIRNAVNTSYARKGPKVIAQNLEAIEASLSNLKAVELPQELPSTYTSLSSISKDAPNFVKNVTAKLLHGNGNQLAVSAMPIDGTWPVSTAKWNKRDLSPVAPVWEPDFCIQCGQCVVICPHGVIEVKQAATEDLKNAPLNFPTPELRGKGAENRHYLLQLDLPNCTGCGLCVEICPARSKTQANLKALHQEEKAPRLEREEIHLDFFRSVPAQQEQTQHRTMRGVQFLPQRFEYPGACSGCGETSVLKLISQLFGDRMLIANATGCSSIYGGNLPTTPWTTDAEGRGPAWANSLFEDNAEFGYGFRISADLKRQQAEYLLKELVPEQAEELIQAPLDVPSEIEAQRQRISKLNSQLKTRNEPKAKLLLSVLDTLIKRSVWIIGGDGWACDIGFGGLDHVLASGRNVNVLVLDTEVYSNTGGQASKSTPLGAIAKFAAGGKLTSKTDLALHGMLKGNVYVGTIAMGAKLPQALKVLQEAESWEGPSLIIANSPCIAHGYPMQRSLEQQKNAVLSGHWPLLRFDPRLKAKGRPALTLDSGDSPEISLKTYMYEELRFKLLEITDPESAATLLAQAEAGIKERLALFKTLSTGAEG
ncbi:pyruvate:ferredoxin (flavodoxin) oxidoreductase [Kiritimatiellota bacterium B12222]|nr:pyruvate:ferredoxin (flavodoxin) oxidoreductase [Kiritimatiellota bacterium B12222]